MKLRYDESLILCLFCLILIYHFVQEYYYIHRPHGAPLGKLYNKYHNWKNSVRVQKDVASEPKSKKQKVVTHYEELDHEQDHVRALKHENFDFESKLTHWQGCVATRLNSIKKDHERTFELWPMYKEPTGYKLVNTSVKHYSPYTDPT